jgi:hypothetical protein
MNGEFPHTLIPLRFFGVVSVFISEPSRSPWMLSRGDTETLTVALRISSAQARRDLELSRRTTSLAAPTCCGWWELSIRCVGHDSGIPDALVVRAHLSWPYPQRTSAGKPPDFRSLSGQTPRSPGQSKTGIDIANVLQWILVIFSKEMLRQLLGSRGGGSEDAERHGLQPDESPPPKFISAFHCAVQRDGGLRQTETTLGISTTTRRVRRRRTRKGAGIAVRAVRSAASA